MRINQLVRPLKIIGVLYLSYLVLLLVVAMPALNLLAPKLYRSETGRELHLQKIILLNPFTLSVTVRGASSDNPDRSPFWSLERLHANLSLASLWRRQLVLDAVQLQGLSMQIDQTGAERYNFSDILDYRAAHARPAKAEPASAGGGVFPVSIGKIEFGANHLGLRAPYLQEPLAIDVSGFTFSVDNFSTVASAADSAAHQANAATDAATPNISAAAIALDSGHIKVNFLREQQPFSAQIDNLTFAIKDFASALGQDNSYQLAVKLAGGELQTQGKLNLAARHNSGELHLRGISLVPAWQYLAPKLAFQAQTAQLDADLPYQLWWGDKLRYSVANGRAELRAVALQSLRDTDTQLGFKALNIDGIGVDGEHSQVHIGKLALDGLSARGWNQDTQISLLDMFAIQSDADDSEPSPWQIQIDQVSAQNGQLGWRASQIDEAELTLAPLALNVAHIQWPAATPAQFDFKTAINNDTQLTLNGALSPADLTGKLSGAIDALPLRWGNRLLGQQMSATVQSGSASANFELAIDKGQPSTLQSDGRIDQFELQRLPDQQKLLAWKQLQWKKLAVDLSKHRLKLDQVSAATPWLQFRINNDGTNNFQQLMIEHPQTIAPTAAAKSNAAAPTRGRTIATKPVEATPAAAKTAAGSGAAAPAKRGAAPRDNKPWHFAVRNIHTDNGLLDFRDNSLSRPFHATIADFTGNIDGLSNRRGAVAKIGFKGTVDGYAPVALTGTANPFAEAQALNVTLDIANLDLATLTPYSGTYAGYTIDSGRLSVQLAYTLQDKRIKGTNHIIVDNLVLGEQVHGPKVMDLPLRFAIYLLTDSNGVMDLGVDVTGNVDDPDFSIASIIWKAFRNVIIKTATSPFRALANLAGGVHQDDLDRVEFSAGSDRIGAPNNDKLSMLGKALEKKPALRLNISGHVSPWQDIEALRDNSLSQALMQSSGISAADIQQQSKRWQDAVADLYKKRFPADKNSNLETMQKNDAMRDNVELEPRALDELASRRALAVKQALVTEHGVAADRATMAPIDLGADKNPGLHVTMTVE